MAGGDGRDVGAGPKVREAAAETGAAGEACIGMHRCMQVHATPMQAPGPTSVSSRTIARVAFCIAV